MSSVSMDIETEVFYSTVEKTTIRSLQTNKQKNPESWLLKPKLYLSVVPWADFRRLAYWVLKAGGFTPGYQLTWASQVESEKWKCSSLSHVRLCDPTDCSPPGFSVHGILQAGILEWVATSFPEDLPDPGIKPTLLASPALANGFFTSEPPEKPTHAL